jgi:hypothetical protein
MSSSAFDVMGEQFVDIAHTRLQEAEYTLHKPRRGPYQSNNFASRVLWIHNKDRYVVWVVGGKHFLTVNEQELLDELKLTNINNPMSKAKIGEFINDYRLDRKKYMDADPGSRLKKQKTSGGPPANLRKATAQETDAAVAPVMVETAAATTSTGEGEAQNMEAHAEVEGDADQALEEPANAASAMEGEADDVFEQVSEEGAGEATAPSAVKVEAVTNANAEAEEVAEADADDEGEAEAAKDERSDAGGLVIDKEAAIGEKDDEAAEEAVEETSTSAASSSGVQKSQIEIDLQAELDRHKQRADAAEADADNERRKHRNYIKSKGKEVNKLRDEIKSRPSVSEMERLKKENEEAQSILSSEKYQDLKTLGIDATTRLKELIDLTIVSYQKRIDEAKEKGRAYEAAMDAKEAAALASAKEDVYQFKDDYNQWTDITDSGLINAYASLNAMKKTLQYSFNGHTYSLTFVSSTNKTVNFKQLNINTSKLREVRKIERDAAKGPPRESLHNGMLAADRNDILFGNDSPIELPDELVDSWLNTTNFYKPPTQEMSLALSKLADLFGQCSDSDYKYTVDAGTQATHKSSKHVVPHTDGVKDFMSELWIKPAALSQWLSHAHWRGYKHARIVCQGTSKEGYAGMRSHGIGFSMDFAGKNGQAYGPGLYFGLSDHATVGYNQPSGYPPGTFAIGLILTSDKEGWQHHHGGYRLAQMSEEEISAYKTISFGTPVSGVDNAIVLHDPALVLCIGQARSFDDKHGRGWM